MNSQEMREFLRCTGRGSLLDKHMREIGKSTEIGPRGAAPGGIIDRRGDLLMLTAENQSSPRNVCVSVNMQTLRESTLAGAAPLFRAQLDIIWGTGKGEARAVVDLKRGAQLVVPATSLTCSALYLDDVGGTGPRLKVSASAGYGTRPGSDQALTFTDARTVPLAANTTSVTPFRIPAYATRVMWLSPDDPTAFAPADALLTFTDTSLVVGFPAIALSNPARAAFVPIPNGSEFIRISNIGGAASTYFLMYELSI